LFSNKTAALRKKKLRVALVRNFWVATYRNPAGNRQKGKREFIGSQNPRTTRLKEGKGGCWVSGINGTRDTKALGLSPFLVLAALSLDSILSFGFILSHYIPSSAQGRIWACKCF
jgi:hypothetical protein